MYQYYPTANISLLSTAVHNCTIYSGLSVFNINKNLFHYCELVHVVNLPCFDSIEYHTFRFCRQKCKTIILIFNISCVTNNYMCFIAVEQYTFCIKIYFIMIQKYPISGLLSIFLYSSE